MVSIREQIGGMDRTRRRNDASPSGPVRCRKKFLRYFSKGFYGEKFEAWERGYKWAAHERWNSVLNRADFHSLLRRGHYEEIAQHAVRAESPTNLLFSFEKMALRDAVSDPEGAQIFAEGLYRFLHGGGDAARRFENWCDAVESLPARRSRVFTHPVVTVFGFIAQPDEHIFLKPMVTRKAAERYGFDLRYKPRPSWETYASVLDFARVIGRDLRDLKPRDMIDIQSFIWVQGSDEYT
jgi:hypothetical protein